MAEKLTLKFKGSNEHDGTAADRNNILWLMAVKVTLKDQLHRELCKGYAWTVGHENVFWPAGCTGMLLAYFL